MDARRLAAWSIVIGLLGVLALARGAWGGPPINTLRGLFGEVNRILADAQASPDERLHAVLKLATEAFDATGATALSLGEAWHGLTPAERREFTALFTALLERAFVLRMAARADLEGGVAVRYLGETVDDGRATVRTAVAGRHGEEVAVEYGMIRRGQGWAIRDVAIDGVSVVANYRAQFHRVIGRTSYQELVGQVRTRVAEPAPVRTVVEDTLGPIDDGPPMVPPRVESRAAPDGRVTERSEGPAHEDPKPGVASQTPTALPVSAPASPVVPTAAGPVGKRAYWVQVGAFRSPAGASALVGRLGTENPIVTSDPLPGASGEPLLRVRLGPFADREAATAKLVELRDRGYPGFIAINPE